MPFSNISHTSSIWFILYTCILFICIYLKILCTFILYVLYNCTLYIKMSGAVIYESWIQILILRTLSFGMKCKTCWCTVCRTIRKTLLVFRRLYRRFKDLVLAQTRVRFIHKCVNAPHADMLKDWRLCTLEGEPRQDRCPPCCSFSLKWRNLCLS